MNRRVRLEEIQAPSRWSFVGGPFGSKLTQQDYVETGVPVIRGVNLGRGRFHDEDFVFVSEEKAADLASNMAFPGDVVFTQRGTLGGVGLIPRSARFNRYVISQSQMKLTVDPRRANACFIYYLFLWEKTASELVAMASSSGVPHINLGTLRAFEINLPPLDVQCRIARFLAMIDDLIDNNLRRIRALEELASVLFARFSASAPRATVTQRPVADLIKQGLLEVNDGYRAKNDELNAPGLPFARAGNVNDGFQLDGADVLQESSVARADRKVSRSGDIVFTSKGTVGRFAYVHASVPRFVYSPQLCFWRSLRPEQLSPRYLYRWMRSDAFTRQVNMVKGSTTMADYVSLGDQRRMKVDVPSVEDQRRLDEQLEPVEDSIANLTARNATLRKLRDLLLPKLLSGEVDVSRLPLPPEELVESSVASEGSMAR